MRKTGGKGRQGTFVCRCVRVMEGGPRMGSEELAINRADLPICKGEDSHLSKFILFFFFLKIWYCLDKKNPFTLQFVFKFVCHFCSVFLFFTNGELVHQNRLNLIAKNCKM